jgi:hypothetical protein
MRSIAKENLIGMHARPTAPQSPRDIAPTPDAKSCTAMNHAAASTVNVVTEGLLLDHGDT